MIIIILMHNFVLDFREREKIADGVLYLFFVLIVCCRCGCHFGADAREERRKVCTFLGEHMKTTTPIYIRLNSFEMLIRTQHTGQRNPLTQKSACIFNNLKHIYMRAHHYHIFGVVFLYTSSCIWLKPKYFFSKPNTHIKTSLISCST